MQRIGPTLLFPVPPSVTHVTAWGPGRVLNEFTTSPFFIPKHVVTPVSSPITTWHQTRQRADLASATTYRSPTFCVFFVPGGSRRIVLRCVEAVCNRSCRCKFKSMSDIRPLSWGKRSASNSAALEKALPYT